MLGTSVVAGAAPHLLSSQRQQSAPLASPNSASRNTPLSCPFSSSAGPVMSGSDSNENVKDNAAHTNGNAMSDYAFPVDKFRWNLSDAAKTPLVLVACGSFSPITYLHLRMFEICYDYLRRNTEFELVAEYLSPVADAYKKAGLASATHRVKMCQLAAETTDRLMVDAWEANQEQYTRTAVVLDRFDHEINTIRGGVTLPNGEKRKCRIALLAGADLIGTMSTPGVWSDEDLDHILGKYGAFIVERSGTDMDEALAQLQPWKQNIYVIEQLIKNDVSSTKIRAFLKKDLSVRYLIPTQVIDYIDENGLYDEEGIRPHSRNRSHDLNRKDKDSRGPSPQSPTAQGHKPEA